MKVGKEYKVEITQLKISKPFIKVIARNLSTSSREFLESLKTHYERKRDLSYEVELGALYIACISPTRYERCRVIQSNEVDKTVLVVFIDCGYQCVVWYNQLKSVDSTSIRALKPLYREFTIADVKLKQSTNYTESILQLHDMIVGKELLIVVKASSDSGYLVDLKLDEGSLIKDVIPNHQFLSAVLTTIKREAQVELIAEKKKERDRQIEEEGFRPATLVESPGNGKEFSFFPEPGVDHKVRISAYENGPHKFFVQFLSKDTEYQKFQCGLQAYKSDLERAKSKAVNAKYIAIIEGQLYRVVLLQSDCGMAQGNVKVRLMETGTISLVASKNLYSMPSEVANVPPFAIQYQLADLHKVDSHAVSREELNFYFKHITNQKQLVLRLGSRGSVLQHCQLFTDHSSIIDDCANWRPLDLQYPAQKPLKAEQFRAQVCYAESPNLFFVHISENDSWPFRTLRKSLALFDSPVLRNPHVGSACVVKHMGVNFRGKVIEWVSTDRFKVDIVDFGSVETFDELDIKISDKEFLKLPPFAIACCLREYEGVETVADSAVKKFEETCRDIPEFDIKLIKRLGDRYIVDIPDWNSGFRGTNHSVDLNRSDWSEANTTIGTHFANTRSMKRKFAEESDDDEPLWQDSQVESDFAGSSDNTTVVEATDLPWQEYVVIDTHSDWESLPNRNNTAISTTQDVDTNSTWKENTDVSESAACQRSACSSPGSSSGIDSMSFDPKRIPVRITALVGPEDFTIQNQATAAELKSFQAELQALAKGQSPLTVFKVDTICLAYHVMEECWVRAIIIDVETKDFLVSVKCLDSGSTFSISDQKFLLNIPFKYVIHVPTFAVRCSLPIRHNIHKEDKILSYLRGKRESDLSCSFITKFEGLNFIELFQGEVNVTDLLVEKGYAKRQVIVPFGYGFITFATNQSQFAVQMESSAELLATVRNYTDNYQLIEMGKPEIGQLIMVKHFRKNKFSRARVISFKGEKPKVYLIDVGEYLITDKYGELDNKTIAEIPPLAIKCALDLPSNAQRDKEIAKKFRAFADKGRKRVIVNMVQPGDESARVSIWVEDAVGKRENIAGWLLQR